MTNAQWFKEFDTHLTRDEQPTDYFNRLLESGNFPQQHPFGWLHSLPDQMQSVEHHPEGNVWIHTMIVVGNAAEQRSKSQDVSALMWSALLHDIGKLIATQVLDDGTITADDHDKASEKLTIEFLKECGCDAAFVEKVASLVRWHMQAVYVARDMPEADLAGMVTTANIDELGLLVFADRLGRGMASEKEVAFERESVDLFMKKTLEYIAHNKE